MVREMARIGAADLYLTGGEPFLRQDLPELVEEASAVRVRTHAVTKAALAPGDRAAADHDRDRPAEQQRHPRRVHRGPQ